MYQVILLLGAILAIWPSSSASGDEPTCEVHWRPDLNQAVHEGQQQQRPLLIVFTMERCGYCQLMKKTTYADEHVVASINDNFVPMQISGPEHRRLAQKLGVRLYPTTVIISPENRVIDRMDGYVKPQAMLPRLASAVQATTAQVQGEGSPLR